MKTPFVFFLALLFAADSTSARAGLPSLISCEMVQGPIGRRLDRYLCWAEQVGFSGAVLVAMDGQIVLHKAYGLADRKQDAANRIDTVFSFGSIAKQFTAAAIMKLEETGKLSTDDPITKFFDNVPADKAGITIHHLLTHTAGLIDSHGIHDFQQMDRDTAVRTILKSRLLSQPGEEFSYSNSGYSLAAAIVELVSSRDYVDYMRDEIFAPAGMTETAFMGNDIWTAGRAARIYRGERDNGTPPEKPGPYWVLLGNGGVVTTVGQMYLWDRALRTERVLSEKSKRKIFTPYKNDYGYGWDVLTTKRGTTKHAHNGGSSLGLSAEFQRYVEEDGALILASNATIGDSLAIEYMAAPLSRLVFQDQDELPAPPGLSIPDAMERARLEGKYSFSDGDHFAIWNEGGQPFFGVAGQTALEIVDPEIRSRAADLGPLNERAKTIVQALLNDDSHPLQIALTKTEENPEQRAARWARIFRNWEQRMGEFVRVEVLGSGPVRQYSESETATWVRLHSEKRSRLCRLHWEKGQLRSLGGQAIPYPFYGPLRLQEDDRALVFHFDTGRRLELAIDFGRGGEPEAISIFGPKGPIRAQRIAPVNAN